jgi:hypothetical protein
MGEGIIVFFHLKSLSCIAPNALKFPKSEGFPLNFSSIFST